MEPGYRGGTAPEIQQKIITSYVENLVNSKLDGYNTEPFKINVLSQERIFIEKIFAIKEIYEKDNGELLSKKTRHYYDVYKLLQTEEIHSLLTNLPKIEEIVKDINEINNKYFGIPSIKWEDLVNHVAIKPNEFLQNKLMQGYINDKDLYFNQVDFGDILSELRKL